MIGATGRHHQAVPPGRGGRRRPGQIVDRDQTTKPTQSQTRPAGVSLYSRCQPGGASESQSNTRTERVIRAPEAGVWHGEDFSITKRRGKGFRPPDSILSHRSEAVSGPPARISEAFPRPYDSSTVHGELP